MLCVYNIREDNTKYNSIIVNLISKKQHLETNMPYTERPEQSPQRVLLITEQERVTGETVDFLYKLLYHDNLYLALRWIITPRVSR